MVQSMLYPISITPPISTVATPSTGQDPDVKSDSSLVCVKEMLFAMEKENHMYTSDTETSFIHDDKSICVGCSRRNQFS